MAELADALDSGSNGRKAVQVQVLLPAPCGVSLKDLKSSFDDTPHFLFAEKVIQRSVQGRS